MNSWRTTLFGIVAAIGGAIIGGMELRPEYFAGWPAWIKGAALLCSTIGTAALGLAARDNNKTSEQVGAGPTSTPSSPGRAGAFTSALMVAALGFGLLAGGALVAGCNTTPQQASYRAAGVTTATAEAAMTAWGDYVKRYHPPAAQEAKVKAAWLKYQAAMLAFIDANQAALTLTAGGTNAPPANNLAAAQAAAAAALADLTTLLATFGVK